MTALVSLSSKCFAQSGHDHQRYLVGLHFIDSRQPFSCSNWSLAAVSSLAWIWIIEPGFSQCLHRTRHSRGRPGIAVSLPASISTSISISWVVFSSPGILRQGPRQVRPKCPRDDACAGDRGRAMIMMSYSEQRNSLISRSTAKKAPRRPSMPLRSLGVEAPAWRRWLSEISGRGASRHPRRGTPHL